MDTRWSRWTPVGALRDWCSRLVCGLVLLSCASYATPVAQAEPDRSRLQPNAIRVLDFVEEQFPEIDRIGGQRSDTLPDHPSGHAIDVMVSSREEGDRVLDVLRENASVLGIKYMIWCQTYYPVGGVPKWMPSRGSATANHFDHVHVTTW